MLRPLPGSKPDYETLSGGIASLNPRLIAVTPPGPTKGPRFATRLASRNVLRAWLLRLNSLSPFGLTVRQTGGYTSAALRGRQRVVFVPILHPGSWMTADEYATA